MKKIFILLLSFFWVYLIYPVSIHTEELFNRQAVLSPQLLSLNPFTLVRNRIVPGASFRISINKDIFNKEKEKVLLTLNYKIEKNKQTRSIPVKNVYFKIEDDKLFIEAVLPKFNEFKDIETQSTWSGFLFPYSADLEIKYEKSDESISSFLYPIQIPSVKWAFIWGIVGVVLSFFIISWLKPGVVKKDLTFEKDSSIEEWEKQKKLKRFILYPMNFAISPMGTYSISLAQILIWTYVTIFGLFFVYWITGSFLEITTQILMLLGIGGGTAIGSKMNALSKTYVVPAKFLNLVEKKRIPRLVDLISTGGRPNIFKFQMLIFTFLTAYIVVVEIIRHHIFPPIPDNLVFLMGISSAVYIGNEVIQKSEWEKIKEKTDEIEKYAKENNKTLKTTQDVEALNIPEVDELRNILTGIYS